MSVDLLKLQQKFISTAQPSSSSDASPPAYSLQGTFGPVIASLMNTYNTSPPTDELSRAQAELAQVKDIMVQNVEQILSRGERIELLVDKTDVMAGQATAFRRGARTVRRQMWWKNTRILMLSGVVGLVSSLPIPLHCTDSMTYSGLCELIASTELNFFLCFDSLSPNISGSSNMGVSATNPCTAFATRDGLGVCRKVVLHNNDSIKGPLPINLLVMNPSLLAH